MKMELHVFKGGVHPPQSKHTKDCATVLMGVPSKVVIPMVQHIGAPCQPVVKKGDPVKVGQLIGDTEAFVSAPIYSSVSGTVTSVESRIISGSSPIVCVEIAPDGRQEVFEGVKPPVVDSQEAFLKAVRASGLTGLGGAGFPTHIKLDSQVEYLIINAAECEPLSEADKYLCRNEAEGIIHAIVKTAEHLGAQKKIIALKGQYEAETEALSAAVLTAGTDVEIVRMPTFYPAGDEQIMVHYVTGRVVPERGLPLDVSTVVDNVGTMLNIHNALEGIPVMEKILSVTGEIKAPVILKVPVGTFVADCIREAAPLVQDYAVIVGGPMMGKIIDDPLAISRTVVTKTTGNIIVLPRDHYLVRRSGLSLERIKHQSRSACIQCRMCTDLCPRYLLGHEIRPHLVMRNLWRESLIIDKDEYVRCFGDSLNCCDCGVCDLYSCPMGLSPRKVNDYFKQQISLKGYKKGRNLAPVVLKAIDHSRIPTERLAARIGISSWYGQHADDSCIEFMPEKIFVPFQQHLGKPAIVQVAAGDKVEKGQLIASAQQGASANIHCGVCGVVREVTDDGVHIDLIKWGDSR